jgi:hypothetical protein
VAPGAAGQLPGRAEASACSTIGDYCGGTGGRHTAGACVCGGGGEEEGVVITKLSSINSWKGEMGSMLRGAEAPVCSTTGDHCGGTCE